MMTRWLRLVTIIVLPASLAAGAQERGAMTDVRLMTLDPGHFHAALIQKEMYPGVAAGVDVYAPAGWDLDEHLKRVAAYNKRAEKPTAWQMDVHSGADFVERMLKERPGNAVILSGRNRPKIDRIARSVDAGLHVLADKPWILAAADLPKLDTVLANADAKGIVAYDIMTERFEITTMLQRALVNDAGVFGAIVNGTEADPAVYMESVHHLMKVVSGAPNIRPAWFFDAAEQGEGLNDIGTHLVDLVQWTLFPERVVDYRSEIKVLAAQRWPTVIPESEFQRVTGGQRFGPALAPSLKNGALEYFANTLVSYAVRGVHTKLNVIWDWEAPPGGGDTHFAFYRGSRARIEVRQTAADRYLPELYVVPASPAPAGAGARGHARDDRVAGRDASGDQRSKSEAPRFTSRSRRRSATATRRISRRSPPISSATCATGTRCRPGSVPTCSPSITSRQRGPS